jgi:hypothetical protein
MKRASRMIRPVVTSISEIEGLGSFVAIKLAIQKRAGVQKGVASGVLIGGKIKEGVRDLEEFSLKTSFSTTKQLAHAQPTVCPDRLLHRGGLQVECGKVWRAWLVDAEVCSTCPAPTFRRALLFRLKRPATTCAQHRVSRAHSRTQTDGQGDDHFRRVCARKEGLHARDKGAVSRTR